MAPGKQDIALLAQDFLQFGIGFEQPTDLLQRNAEKLENHNLLQAREIVPCIQAVARAGTLLGAQETEPVIVVQRANGHAG
jgi:hypothetical protein